MLMFAGPIKSLLSLSLRLSVLKLSLPFDNSHRSAKIFVSSTEASLFHTMKLFFMWLARIGISFISFSSSSVFTASIKRGRIVP